ncbi:MAG: N-acetylmuramoyl-L-alanine amidase [Trueperaceae bacterium]
MLSYYLSSFRSCSVCFAFACLMLLSPAFAQQRLLVNGLEVSGLTTTLVSGTAYIPAGGLAEAIGATQSYDGEVELATFDYAAQLLTLRVYTSSAEAKADTSALQLNGAQRSGTGAVALDGSLYVPVKAVVAALGGFAEYSEARQAVLVVFPRATFVDARVLIQPNYDRLILNFEGLTAYQNSFDEVTGSLQLTFEGLTPLQQPQSFTGQRFERAVLQQRASVVDLLLQLKPGMHYETFMAPREGGFSLVLDVIAASTQRQDPLATATIVLDAGHGGGDKGLTVANSTESNLTLELAQQLRDTLRSRGLRTELTRAEDRELSIAERSQHGIGSSFYLSLHADSQLASGQINVYYQAATENANVTIRDNALVALNQPGADANHRRLLLSLVPDLQRGERYATTLARALAQAGYSANQTLGLPLEVLEGAAGRGVLIEFSFADLAKPQLPNQLADAVRTLLAQAEN